MSKESIKAVKDATKYLKELAEAKKDANVSLFQLSTIEVDNDELETTIVQYMDDANHFASHLSAALNEDPDLAHLFGHAIGNLTEESMEAFQEGFIHEKWNLKWNTLQTLPFFVLLFMVNCVSCSQWLPF